MPTRRVFLAASLEAAAGGLVASRSARARPGRSEAFRTAPRHGVPRPVFPDPARSYHGESSLAAQLRAHPLASRPATQSSPSRAGSAEVRGPLRDLFPDLGRHFLFEYYPWYGTDPFRHWEQWDRVPPHDIAANLFPRLGPYDSRSLTVIETHARGMAETGIGGISLSWWGRDSYEDRTVDRVMDVMRDHGLKVAFHLEPYANDRAFRWNQDILYLLDRYGARRRWDAFLVLRDADGREGPVFKGFRTILPEAITDCHDVVRTVPDFTPDHLWRRQNLGLKRLLAQDFDHVTLLADTVNYPRAVESGFDGIAIYDSFVRPATYPDHAAAASAHGLLFSFNCNPGFDGIEPRRTEPGACLTATPFEPPAHDLDWSRASDRERAASLHAERIGESLMATLACQTDPVLTNARRGFLLVYANSWNEWHEGTAFEPMKDGRDLTADERSFGYHNPENGSYRLTALAETLRGVFVAPARPTPAVTDWRMQRPALPPP